MRSTIVISKIYNYLYDLIGGFWNRYEEEILLFLFLVMLGVLFG